MLQNLLPFFKLGNFDFFFREMKINMSRDKYVPIECRLVSLFDVLFPTLVGGICVPQGLLKATEKIGQSSVEMERKQESFEGRRMTMGNKAKSR